MPAQQDAVRGRVLREQLAELGAERVVVLGVVEDRQPLAVLVGRDPRQPLEHLVTLDDEPPLGGLQVGEHGRPHRVGVEDGASIGGGGDCTVLQRFRGWTAIGRVERTPVLIDRHEVSHG